MLPAYPLICLLEPFFPALPQSTESASLFIQVFLKPHLSISFYIFFSHINPPEHWLGICKHLLYVREKAMATHSSTLAWKIPWTEEPGRLQSMGSRRVGHDWATSLSLFTFMHWRRKWQPTPVFLPGESPWTEKPGRLQSMGLHRVGHDWSDAATATTTTKKIICQEMF